jgi:hypothetical protein
MDAPVASRLLFVAISVVSVAAHAQRPAFPEAEVKVQLLERFIRFIDWPAESPREQPFVLCVMGAGALSHYLAELARTHTLKDRRVELAEVTPSAAMDRCQALWIGSGARDVLAETLERTEGKPILTVGDGEAFGEHGVMISLLRSNDRLTFDINLASAKRCGLRFSSQLVRLSRVVKDAPP